MTSLGRWSLRGRLCRIQVARSRCDGLNRREYRNTIEQLTGVKVDVGTLPADGGSGTFDTVGSSQFISSDHFEQYPASWGVIAIDEAFRAAGVLKSNCPGSSASNRKRRST